MSTSSLSTPYLSTNPFTGETHSEYAVATDAEVTRAVERAHLSYLSWREQDSRERAAYLRRAATLFRAGADGLAILATEEMGKPVTESRTEVEIVAKIFDYYADEGPAMLAPHNLAPASGDHARIELQPTGPILGIMPWNFPYYQVARFAAPNLLLGNTVLVKHARNCPRAALAFERVLAEAGLPEGTYTNVFATVEQVESIIADARVQGVSLTGSEAAGAAVAEVAGRHLTKVVLELGGSDPFLVLDGHDLPTTVASAVTARMTNAGQVCTAAERFIVVDDVHDRFVESFAAALNNLTIGDPSDPLTQVGPLASASAVRELVQIVDDAVAKGATVVCGGGPTGAVGNYFEPTVLTGVTPAMRAHHEELFGPVAVVYAVESADAAVEVANASDFGLGAVVFTHDAVEAETVATRLEAGMVTINGVNRSQPDLPFGGVKRSGMGRELGRYGLEEFANKKLIRTPADALVQRSQQ